jgi:hypothetical protein
MRLLHPSGLAAGFALCGALLARDATGEVALMDADRPDMAESPSALGARTAQVELGATQWWLGESAIGEQTLGSVGEILLRVGLGRGWEARFVLPSWFSETRMHPASDLANPQALETRGFGDASVGIKRNLHSFSDRMEAGFIAEVSLPTGDAPFGGGDFAEGVTLAVSLATSLVDLCGNVGAEREGDANSTLATISFQRALASRIAAFAETAWIEEPGVTRTVAGAGLLWQVAGHLRLDARYGAEFIEGSTHPYFGLGLVRRW